MIPINSEDCSLPDEIFLSYQPIERPREGFDRATLENRSGKELVKKMASFLFEDKGLKIITQKYEKPKAYLDEREISVSFSHTSDGVSAAVSARFNVGCDMEMVGRHVNPRLIERIKNNEETDELYRDFAPVRLWTLKEAALKMIGTGLRKPMNKVQIRFVNNHTFGVEFDDGKQAKICSFQHNNHWIAVCYRKCDFV